jgi:hypothetical protein
MLKTLSDAKKIIAGERSNDENPQSNSKKETSCYLQWLNTNAVHGTFSKMPLANY